MTLSVVFRRAAQTEFDAAALWYEERQVGLCTARILGPASIPEPLRQFPSFRQALRLDPRSKEPCRWVLWSGGEELIVAELTADQRSWPIRAIMNDTMLVERALAGWTAEQQQ
jgi:hypothetical protein